MVRRLFSKPSIDLDNQSAFFPRLKPHDRDRSFSVFKDIIALHKISSAYNAIGFKGMRHVKGDHCGCCKTALPFSSSVFNSRDCFTMLRDLECKVVSGEYPTFDVYGFLNRYPKWIPSLKWIGEMIGRQACMTQSVIHINDPIAASMADYPKLTAAENLLKEAFEDILREFYPRQ